MLRKTLTVLAASAVIAGGTAGVAYADTPVKSATSCVVSTGGVLGTITGVLGSGGSCLLPGTGTDTDTDHHHRHFPGGYGGAYGGAYGSYGGSYWQRGGVILPYSQVASDCGCSQPASLGYTLVQQPQQVQVVPVGVAAGDGSCALNQVNWNDARYRRGVRFFRR